MFQKLLHLLLYGTSLFENEATIFKIFSHESTDSYSFLYVSGQLIDDARMEVSARLDVSWVVVVVMVILIPGITHTGNQSSPILR